jgi:RecB family exonuclease
LQYGTIVHGIIEKIHEGRRQNNPPNLEELRTYATNNLPLSGYASPRSRERAHAQVQKTVETIYERFMSAPLPLEAELPFSILLPDSPLKVIGRIDAVYQLEQGVEIRDFKTGTSVTSAEKAKRRATASNQLALYALAWQELHDEMPALLTLDFVETDQQGSVRKQAKSLVTLTRKLEDMVEHLKNGEYPEGKDHSFCNHPLSK